MSDPQILRLLGVEVQLELWRGSSENFLATFTLPNGEPDPIPDKRVVFIITDKVNGAIKYSQVREPGDITNGSTLLTVPAAVTMGLTDARSYTWKYIIYTEDIHTVDRIPRFYGDVRILVPPQRLGVQALSVSVADTVQTGEGIG